jgi:hypothetical protein
MTVDRTWRELYQDALLELRPEELRQRIAEAERAIQGRILELSQAGSSSVEESHELDDALRGLRVLAQVECRGSGAIVPGMAPVRVMP